MIVFQKADPIELPKTAEEALEMFDNPPAQLT
jgi:hypothetical protein